MLVCRLSGLPGFEGKTSPEPAIEGAFTPASGWPGGRPFPGPGPRLCRRRTDHPSGPPRLPAARHMEQLGPPGRDLQADVLR